MVHPLREEKAMPVKLTRNQERAAEDAYRVARLKREQRAKGSDLPRLDGHAEERARVERSREGTAS